MQPNTALDFQPNKHDGVMTVSDIKRKQATIRRIDSITKPDGLTMTPWRSGLLNFLTCYDKMNSNKKENVAANGTGSFTASHNEIESYVQRIDDIFISSTTKKRARGGVDSVTGVADDDSSSSPQQLPCAKGSTIKMTGSHLVGGKYEFDWTDHDQVGATVVPVIVNDADEDDRRGGALADDGVVIEKGLTLPQALPPADKAAYDFLVKMWQEQNRIDAERKKEAEKEKKRADEAAEAEAERAEAYFQNQDNNFIGENEGDLVTRARRRLKLLTADEDDF